MELASQMLVIKVIGTLLFRSNFRKVINKILLIYKSLQVSKSDILLKEEVVLNRDWLGWRKTE